MRELKGFLKVNHHKTTPIVSKINEKINEPFLVTLPEGNGRLGLITASSASKN